MLPIAMQCALGVAGRWRGDRNALPRLRRRRSRGSRARAEEMRIDASKCPNWRRMRGPRGDRRPRGSGQRRRRRRRRARHSAPAERARQPRPPRPPCRASSAPSRRPRSSQSAGRSRARNRCAPRRAWNARRAPIGGGRRRRQRWARERRGGGGGRRKGAVGGRGQRSIRAGVRASGSAEMGPADAAALEGRRAAPVHYVVRCRPSLCAPPGALALAPPRGPRLARPCAAASRRARAL